MSIQGLNTVLVIAKATVKEAIRSKILVIAVIMAFLAVIAGYVFGSVAVGDSTLIIRDFGVFSISISSLIYIIITGTSLLYKELSQKTIYNLMSKPIDRWCFVVGKFIGLAATGSLVIAIGGITLLSYFLVYDNLAVVPLLFALFFMILEVVLISAITIFFSSIVITPFLNGFFVLCMFLVGRNIEYLRKMAELSKNFILELLYYLLPRFSDLYVGDQVAFELSPSLYHLSFGLLYVISYSIIAVAIATYFFNKKEFN